MLLCVCSWTYVSHSGHYMFRFLSNAGILILTLLIVKSLQRSTTFVFVASILLSKVVEVGKRLLDFSET